MEPILTVKDLSVSFTTRSGEFDAVKNVSFELGKGETLGIVGESGSGKSVTAQTIMKLIPSRLRRLKVERLLFTGRACSKRQINKWKLSAVKISG